MSLSDPAYNKATMAMRFQRIISLLIATVVAMGSVALAAAYRSCPPKCTPLPIAEKSCCAAKKEARKCPGCECEVRSHTSQVVSAPAVVTTFFLPAVLSAPVEFRVVRWVPVSIAPAPLEGGIVWRPPPSRPARAPPQV